VTKALTLEEALRAWGDPAEVAEMTRLENEGCGWQESIVHRSEADSRKIERCRELHERLETAQLARLREGSLIATGYDSRAAIDAPPTAVRADRWRVLTPNTEDSSAAGGGLSIFGILVSEAKSGDAAIGASSPQQPQAVVRRLVLVGASQLAIIDGVEKHIPMQPFNLLKMLANAVLDGSVYVSLHDIETANSGGSAADLVRKLRALLAADATKDEDRKALIRTRRSPTKYYLALAAHELELRP